MNLSRFLIHPVFSLVSQIAGSKGLEAYVIGGFVRDLLLERPLKDIDIVIVGSGIDVAAEAAAILAPGTQVAVFKNFGTAMFRYQNIEIEFVGARKESYRSDSRNPDVESGTLSDDQHRRDFTINAMAISLNSTDYGELLDPFNGQADLEERIIRTPLDPLVTFSDDPLRMIRAIRFASTLYFTIEPQTYNAIKQNCNRIDIVSEERIIDELNKILMADTPSTGFGLLEDTGILALVLPEVSNLRGVEYVHGRSHKDNFVHTLKVLDNVCLASDNLWLRWAALLHDIGKPATRRYDNSSGWTFHNHDFVGSKMVAGLFRRLKMPLNEKMKYVEKLVALHLRPIALVNDDVSDSAIRRLLFDAGDDTDDLMTLCEADITSRFEDKVKQFQQNFKRVRQKLKEIEEKDAVRNFQPPITGEIIIQTFNLHPCREIGMIKNAIKEAILDGVIQNNYDEAFRYMLKIGEQMGIKAVLRKD